MTRARELANLADDVAGLETLTVSDVTDLSVSASNINSATNQITDSSTDLNVDSNTLVVDKSANNVGIGTNSPTVSHSGYNGSTLNLYQSGTSSAGSSLRFTSATSGTNTGDGAIVSYWSDNVLYINNQENADTAFYNNGSESMRITSGGHVGIGKSPSTPLHIYKTGLADASTTALLTIDGKFVSNTIDSSDKAGIAFRLENALGGSQTTTCIASSYAPSYNHLLLQPAGGNVGIGSTTPISALDITGGNNGASSITLKNTAPNPDSHWQITPSYASDVLQFRSANNSYASRLNIIAGGGIEVLGGNIVIGTTGQGIDFSSQTGTNNPDATGELLNHFEEGTCTLNFEDESDVTLAMNSSFQTGSYTRVGNVVTVTGDVRITGKGSSSATERLRLGGLPFLTKNTNSGKAGMSIGVCVGLDSTHYPSDHPSISAFAEAGTTYCVFRINNTANGDTDMAVQTIGNGFVLIFTLTYICNF